LQYLRAKSSENGVHGAWAEYFPEAVPFRFSSRVRVSIDVNLGADRKGSGRHFCDSILSSDDKSVLGISSEIDLKSGRD